MKYLDLSIPYVPPPPKAPERRDDLAHLIASYATQAEAIKILCTTRDMTPPEASYFLEEIGLSFPLTMAAHKPSKDIFITEERRNELQALSMSD